MSLPHTLTLIYAIKKSEKCKERQHFLFHPDKVYWQILMFLCHFAKFNCWHQVRSDRSPLLNESEAYIVVVAVCNRLGLNKPKRFSMCLFMPQLTLKGGTTPTK